jgi:hypothetical protein
MKGVFCCFEPLWVRLASSLQKNLKKATEIFFSTKFRRDIKNQETKSLNPVRNLFKSSPKNAISQKLQ